MARVARMAGALLVETEGSYYLVGQTKEPCDFVAAGFELPIATPSADTPCVKLAPMRLVALVSPWLTLELEGDALARMLASRLLIERNASVSERLWRLVAGANDEGEIVGDQLDARWLAEVPEALWNIIRDQVLRCL